MKFKIDWQRITSDPLHILWITGYAIVFGFVFSLLNAALSRLLAEGRILNLIVLPVPFVSAGGLLIQEGLERFSGHPISHTWRIEHTFLLLSIIFSYVIVFPLVLWGLRERAQWRQSPRSGKFPYSIALSLGAGGFFLSSIVLLSVVGPLISFQVHRSMRNAQAVEANRDALISDLGLTALKAQSFYFASTDDGGGGKRWLNIKGRSKPSLTIEEIWLSEPVLARIYGSAFPQRSSSFVLKVFKEDSLAIWGIGTEKGDDENFTNKNGEKGKLQVYGVVSPTKMVVQMDN